MGPRQHGHRHEAPVGPAAAEHVGWSQKGLEDKTVPRGHVGGLGVR